AQGCGPLRRPWRRRLAARALNGAAEVTVRDRLSYEMLLELGVDPAAVTITADPVFALAPGAPEPVATAAASPDPAAAGAAASGGAPAGAAASGGPAVAAGRRGGALGPPGGRLIGRSRRPGPWLGGNAAANTGPLGPGAGRPGGCRRRGFRRRAGRPGSLGRPGRFGRPKRRRPGPPRRPAHRVVSAACSRAGRRRRDEPGAGRPGHGPAASPGRVGRLRGAAAAASRRRRSGARRPAPEAGRARCGFKGRRAGGLV